MEQILILKQTWSHHPLLGARQKTHNLQSVHFPTSPQTDNLNKLLS